MQWSGNPAVNVSIPQTFRAMKLTWSNVLRLDWETSSLATRLLFAICYNTPAFIDWTTASISFLDDFEPTNECRVNALSHMYNPQAIPVAHVTATLLLILRSFTGFLTVNVLPVPAEPLMKHCDVKQVGEPASVLYLSYTIACTGWVKNRISLRFIPMGLQITDRDLLRLKFKLHVDHCILAIWQTLLTNFLWKFKYINLAVQDLSETGQQYRHMGIIRDEEMKFEFKRASVFLLTLWIDQK